MKPFAVLVTLATMFVATSLAVADDDTGTSVEETTTPPPEKSGRSDAPGPSLGLSPSAPQVGDLIVPTDAPPGAADANSDDLKLQFHGFFRAPMRLSIGRLDEPAPMQSDTQVHSPPQVPGSSYTGWPFTNTVYGPWTELNFSYGNKRAAATVIVAAYNLTDAGYRDLSAQLGINQAFLTLHSPKLGKRAELTWTVGAFSNRYGGSGKYDAGKYETYVIGRTHTAGETLNAEIALTPSLALHLEHGVGAKLDVPPYHDPPVVGMPYPGPVPQASTMLHHAHIGLAHKKGLLFGAHFMNAWTQDARAAKDMPDADLKILGVDARVDGGVAGEGYVGYSHLKAAHILPLADAIEVLHSIGGWQLRDNFFGAGSDGTGSIDSILLQYTYSIATLLRHPEPFWGQGPDVLVSTFGMYNRVRSTDPAQDGVKKLKWGVETTYTPLSWFAVSGRFDMVNPDMANSQRSFEVLSPRLIFRTSFVSHEQVQIGYSRYFYGSEVVPSYPYMDLRPDKHLFQASAVMWW